MEDGRNMSGMTGNQTDGMASLQVAQKPQQQADNMGICVAKRTRRGLWNTSHRGTRLKQRTARKQGKAFISL